LRGTRRRAQSRTGLAASLADERFATFSGGMSRLLAFDRRGRELAAKNAGRPTSRIMRTTKLVSLYFLAIMVKFLSITRKALKLSLNSVFSVR
jgi:hypothetical protein